jgi:hypothetical protein
MKSRLVHVLVAATLTLVAAIAATVPASAQQTVRKFEGRVTSIDRSERSFRLSGERGTFKVFVTSATRYQRVTFAGLRVGSAKIEATVRRSNGRWVATKVERSGGSSSSDDRGRGRGSDDTQPDDSRR